jgi:hypothetical protein
MALSSTKAAWPTMTSVAPNDVACVARVLGGVCAGCTVCTARGVCANADAVAPDIPTTIAANGTIAAAMADALVIVRTIRPTDSPLRFQFITSSTQQGEKEVDSGSALRAFRAFRLHGVSMLCQDAWPGACSRTSPVRKSTLSS